MMHLTEDELAKIVINLRNLAIKYPKIHARFGTSRCDAVANAGSAETARRALQKALWVGVSVR
jgi:hypothetical protein